MITELDKQIQVLPPLIVTSARIEDSALILSGNDWRFLTSSAWRIMDSAKMYCGCEDDEFKQAINVLLESSLIRIKVQSVNFCADPIFLFSNGYRLEVFSTQAVNSWVFELPSGQKIIAP